MTLQEIYEKYGIGTKFQCQDYPIHTITGEWKNGNQMGILYTIDGSEERKATFLPELNDYRVVE